ncbi:hypothetical protein HHL17_22270 [Chitinophaga sp. G-6-1-13]|uniref:Uncharacterized protein n=1 Tax=Chitinophaga fulva TaxID=2728842 RepID=A0A848GT84_9BACT|nr:hypothetical protein [Chitinophaga fulva]NML39943.1 hypothetical protein [Chitinophaga fulva]
MAAKLNQVPVPDMADSIWASIELQLDAVADTPDDHSSDDAKDNQQTDNHPTENNTAQYTAAKKSIVKYLSKGWYGFAGAAAAASALWWYTSHQAPAPEKTAPVKAVPETHAPAPPDSSATVTPAETQPVPANKKKDSVSLMNVLSRVAPPPDSSARQVSPPPVVDSPAIQHQRYLPLVTDSVQAVPVKKPRGVKGITEDDYRISVQKDSSGKKN